MRTLQASLAGAMLSLLLAASVSAEPVDPGTEYMISVVAPALRADCEGVRPGFGARFDAVYPAWKERNARQIRASKLLLKQAEQVGTDEVLEAGLVAQARRFFAEDDDDGRKEGCDRMLETLSDPHVNSPVEA